MAYNRYKMEEIVDTDEITELALKYAEQIVMGRKTVDRNQARYLSQIVKELREFLSDFSSTLTHREIRLETTLEFVNDVTTITTGDVSRKLKTLSIQIENVLNTFDGLKETLKELEGLGFASSNIPIWSKSENDLFLE